MHKLKPGCSGRGAAPGSQVEPWNRWLIFHDEKVEGRFWLERCQTVLLYGDRLWVCQKLYQGCLSILKKGVPAVALVVLFIGSILGPLIGVVISIKQKDAYIWHRNSIIGVMQMGVMASSSAVGHLINPPMKTPLAVGKRLLVNSNLATGLSGGILLHLQCRSHLKVLVATTLIGVFSTPMHCKAWFSSSDRPMFAEVVGSIDRFLLSYGLSKRVDPPPDVGEGSCILVVSFLHVFLDLCIPLLLTFVMELAARVGYATKKDLCQREGGGPVPNLYVSFWVQTLIAFWSILTCSQVIWILWKSVATLMDADFRKFMVCERH